jgi:ribonuclease D
MPPEIKLNWIGTEKDIPLLDQLLKEPNVGIDSEWRMKLYNDRNQVLPLIQMSGEKEAFLIDTMALGQSEQLDEKLTQIFLNPDSTLLGFSFHSDLSEFRDRFPNMQFYKNIQNFLDIQHYYGLVFDTDQQTGLLKVAEDLFGRPLCKHEQISNWERRPLRLSQQHYGALDAWVLPQMLLKLKELDKKGMLKIRTIGVGDDKVEDAERNGGGKLTDEEWAEQAWGRMVRGERWKFQSSLAKQSELKAKKDRKKQ